MKKSKVDRVIDEILLKSLYGKKAFEDRQKRLREKSQNKAAEQQEEIVIDHPKQTYINFEEVQNDK